MRSAKTSSRLTSKTPNNGSSVMTVNSAMTVEIIPAAAKFWIISEPENSNATKEIAAVACVSTQAGPTTRMALRKASRLLSPQISLSRAANVSCMLSEKLMTMMSGVITFRKVLSLKSSQPSVPSARRIAISGGPAAIIMKDMRRKNTIAIRQPGRKPDAVVKQLVALDGIADFKAHDGHAGKLDLEPGSLQILSGCLADGGDNLRVAFAVRHGWIERDDHESELAILREQLAPDDLVAERFLDQTHRIPGLRGGLPGKAAQAAGHFPAADGQRTAKARPACLR